MSFDNLGLDDRLLSAVRSMGYTAPTPIQEQAIPLVLAGRDVVGCAQTGTGKTAAFVLPTLQRIQSRPGAPRALVVTPTRELALQIDEVARTVSRTTRHRTAVVYGGVGYEPQRQAMKRGVDMLVATPGRLLDLAGQGHVDLSRVEVLVLDEADRMLDQGFWPDVRRILALLPSKRQNLLFSATMTDEVLKVIGETLTDPAHVDVSPPSRPIEAIEQALYPVSGEQKNDLLVKMINHHGCERVLVFTRTKHRADRVARTLDRAGIRSAAIHGNRSQAQRVKALDEFKRGRCRVLVATDIVARGIDVEGISHVINFDLPNVPEDYVHRIGRTARAGKSGWAFTMMAPEEHDNLRDIEKTIGAIIERGDDITGFDYSGDRLVPDPARTHAGPRKNPAPQGARRQGRRGGSGRYNRSGAQR
ncbi:MAG: DEAD/DEAH box helicase [Coriobacteriia bacterium]|nr:DEAD/DEAH box helicase [Coriobacteriia bacterium]